MRVALAFVLAACGGPGTSVDGYGGTIAFAEAVSGSVRIADVATSELTTIDPGKHGRVSISPDAQHIAYVGSDLVVKVADRAGAVTPLTTVGSCLSTPTWGPNNSLSYCVATPVTTVTELVPGIGAMPRRFTGAFAMSSDGQTLAFVELDTPGGPSQLGDLFVEGVDGTNRRLLRQGVAMGNLQFVLGDRLLVAMEYRDPTFMVVAVSVADGTTSDLGAGILGGARSGFFGGIRDGSIRSPDDREVLVEIDNQLVAVDVETAARRVFATLAVNVDVSSASFLDSDLVVYEAFEDRSVSDIGVFRMSVHLATPTSDVTLREATMNNTECHPAAVSTTTGHIAVSCGVAELLRLDGSAVVETSTFAQALGITPDGEGLLAIDFDGAVTVIDATSTRTLARTLTFQSKPGVDGPFVDYVP